jgi:capsular polysaccharide biosynthesis protein
MKKKFFQNLFKNLIQHIFKIKYGHISILKDDKNLNIISSNVSQIKINNKEYKINDTIYEIPNGRVYTDNVENVAYIKDTFLIPKISFQQVDGELKDIEFNKVLFQGTPRMIKKYKGTILSLVQGASGKNYFHFLFDILTKIKLLEEKYSLNKIDYFYISGNYEWQQKILQFYGISKDKIINSDNVRHVKANKILAVEHPWYKKGFFQYEIQNIPEWIIFYLRDKFLLHKAKFNSSKKFYIDRSDSQNKHCKIYNNHEIMKYLNQHEFKSYQISKLKIEEQVYLFNNANIIISPHGAALSNIIFSKAGMKLFEIIPKGHPSRKCEYFSKLLNLDYNRVELTTKKNDFGEMELSQNIIDEMVNKAN